MIGMSEHSGKVGDDFELDGHCIVAAPDGTVVTASRSVKLVMDGEYRIIYADNDIETVVVGNAAGAGYDTGTGPEPDGIPLSASAGPVPVSSDPDAIESAVDGEE